jgi:hypothetical protein
LVARIASDIGSAAVTPQPDATERRPLAPLLDRVDVAWMLALTTLGMGLRCWYFSGYGLGDDIIIRHATAWFLESGNSPGANYAYRFVWWLPTVLTAAVLGVTEAGLLAPILLAAAASFPLVYALGKALWDRPGGIVSALLLGVIPIDFAWATMMTPDIPSSVLVGGCMLCLLRAAVFQTTRTRRRLLALAALLAWLAFYVKVSVGLLGLPVLALLWMHRRALGQDVLVFFGTSLVLFGAAAYVTFALTGDPLHPLTSEVEAQGLTGPEAAQWHPVSWYVFMHFPRAIFGFDAYGHALFGGLPNLLLVLALLGPLLGLRPRAPELWWWLLVLAIGLQFNFQRAEGVWVAGFRNVRHLHGIVYPLVLLVAGYLVRLRARSGPTYAVVLTALLAFGLWQSAETAMLTRVSFADRRAACRFLLERERQPIYSDFQIETWCAAIPGGVELRVTPVPSLPSPQRTAMLAAVERGYLVTGGSREPHYGCLDCIPKAGEIDPAAWRLLLEVPGPIPPTPWRPEPLRVWERIVPPPPA